MLLFVFLRSDEWRRAERSREEERGWKSRVQRHGDPGLRRWERWCAYVRCHSVYFSRTHWDDCPDERRGRRVGSPSKRALRVGTVQRVQNIHPSSRISDEKAVSLSVT